MRTNVLGEEERKERMAGEETILYGKVSGLKWV